MATNAHFRAFRDPLGGCIRLLALLVLHCPAGTVLAQTPGPDTAANTAPLAIRALGVSDAIRVDGSLDEREWGRADKASGFIQSAPQPGAPASQQTEVSIVYDQEAIYVGARLFDVPDSIVARLARRDEAVFSDWFYVALDTYDDNRTAFVFGVNPRGMQRDLLIFDDTREDSEWDAVWQVATRRDSLGWTAEFRIPISQLRFRLPSDPRQELTWGVNFWRRIARREEMNAWAPMPADVDRRVSLFGELTDLRDLQPGRRLSLLPYAAGGVTHHPDARGNPFQQGTGGFAGAGADVEYSPNPNLTFAATLNPDFGQVEADPAVVNLTAFETFVPEKRPFFLEGAEIFDVKGPQLFYTRRIGRRPRGSVPASAVHDDVPERTTILGAAKLTGRTASGWSIGALAALTDQETARYSDTLGVVHPVPVEPLTSSSVLRLSRSQRNGQTIIGGIFTAANRPGLPDQLAYLPAAAYTTGTDLRHRFGNGAYEVAAGAYASHVRGSEAAITRLQRSSARYYQRADAEHVEFDATRTSLTGWNGEARVRNLGGRWRWIVEGAARSPGFEINEIGFLGRVDVIEQSAQIAYVRSAPTGIFRRYVVRVREEGELTFGAERTGSLLRTEFDADLRSLWNVFVRVQYSPQVLSTTGLRGGPALRTDGASAGFARLRTDLRKPFWAELAVGYANAHGTRGNEVALTPMLSYRPASNVELSVQPQLIVARTPDQFVTGGSVMGRSEYVVAEIFSRTATVTTRFSYAASPSFSLQLYAQPFLSAGSYTRFARVADPQASRFGYRFDPLDDRLVELSASTYGVDFNSDGSPDLRFARPDFTSKQFRSTVVARWEYAPGSALFVVWSRGQSERERDGTFEIARGFGELLGLRSTDTLLMKATYWIGL